MAIERDMTSSRLSGREISALGARLSGEVLRPGDEGYEAAREVWNAAVDRRPALIVRPRDATEVQEAVAVTRAAELPLAIRGGGHSTAGHGTVDEGVVLDLSMMKGIAVDPERRVAWAEPGLTWGEYNTHLAGHGLATPGGDVASVGVAGLTLSGGMGWLMRRHGMTIDNLIAVEMVTAEGRLMTANDTEHADLFWALRGGGGNFGVATRLMNRLHPVGTVLGGVIVYPATHDGLRAYAEATVTAPDDLTTITFVQNAPPLPFLPPEVHGTPVHLILPCFVGDREAGDAALAPLRSLAGQTPLADTVRPLPYPALFEYSDHGSTRRRFAIRNGFLSELSDETVDIILEHIEAATSPFAVVALRELGGAMSRVAVDATAFAHRDKAFYLAGQNGWDDHSDDARHIAWTEGFWQAVQGRTDGAYAGFLGDEGEARVQDAYPPATYERLATIKRRYDPGNLFRSNANIKPTHL